MLLSLSSFSLKRREEVFEVASELDIHYVEWDFWNDKYDLGDARRGSREHGIEILSCHAASTSSLGSENPFRNAKALRRVERGIERASELGASFLIIHSPKLEKGEQESERIKRFSRELAKLSKLAREKDIVILIENMDHNDPSYAARDPKTFLRLVRLAERYSEGEGNLGVCIDTSHSGPLLAEFVALLGDRICELHLSGYGSLEAEVEDDSWRNAGKHLTIKHSTAGDEILREIEKLSKRIPLATLEYMPVEKGGETIDLIRQDVEILRELLDERAEDKLEILARARALRLEDPPAYLQRELERLAEEWNVKPCKLVVISGELGDWIKFSKDILGYERSRPLAGALVSLDDSYMIILYKVKSRELMLRGLRHEFVHYLQQVGLIKEGREVIARILEDPGYSRLRDLADSLGLSGSTDEGVEDGGDNEDN